MTGRRSPRLQAFCLVALLAASALEAVTIGLGVAAARDALLLVIAVVMIVAALAA